MSSHTSTFLGLPAELRNTIYKYAFTASAKITLAPHALTRVNQQIRRESLDMYYSHVTSLDIPMRRLEDIDRAKRWLNEEDMQLYPVFPDFHLSLPGHFKPISGIRCIREQINVAQELSTHLDRFNIVDEYDVHEVVRIVYRSSLGVFHTGKLRLGKVSERFKKAALGKDEEWLMRRVTYDRFSMQPENGSTSEIRRLYGMFFRLVIKRDGREWDKGDLKQIADFFESSIRHHAGEDL